MRNRAVKRAAFLLTVILFSVSILPVSFAESYEDTGLYRTEIDAVTGLGIMDGENSKQFFPDDYLDRAEMVRILMKLRNSSVGDRRQRFIDVRPDYYAFAEIDEAVHLGYITVGKDRLFKPEEKATSEEAMKLLLYMLNYKTYLDGGVSSIHYLANTAGLLKGISFSGAYITKAQLAKMIYNSFSAKMQEVRGTAGDSILIEESKEKTTLFYLGIKMTEGVVMANSDTSIYYSGPAASPGCVRIDDETFLEGASGAANLIGYYVEAFVTDTKTQPETVVHIVKAGRDKSLTVEAEEINHVENLIFNYGTTRGKNISLSEDMCVIYNGVSVKFDEALFRIGYGSVTFVKSESLEGKGYNIAVIDEYESYVVSSVSAGDEKIYLKNGTFRGSMYIDVSKNNAESVYYFENGKPSDFSAVTADSVISVFYGSGAHDVIRINISKKTFTATMKEICPESDRGEPVTVFDGERYVHGPNIVGAEKLTLGESYALSLDFKGYLLEVLPGSSVKNYAALIRLNYDEAEDACYVKLLTKDSGIAIYRTVSDKIRYVKGKNKRNVNPEELAALLSGEENTLILTELNSDGLIKGITVSAPYDTSDLISNEGAFTLYKQVTTSTTASYGAVSGIGTGNAYIFIIPPEEDGKVDYSAAIVKKGGYFAAGNSYKNISFYDVDLSAQAGAVLIRNKAGGSLSQSGYEGGVFLVENVSTAINADDELIMKITGYQNGQSVTVSVSLSEFDADASIYSVATGDVLLYATNSKSEISAYAILYSDSLHKNSFKQTFVNGNGFGTTRTCSVYHAMVQYVSDKYLTLSLGGETVPAYGNTKAYVYKINRSSGEITSGEWGDIIAMNPYTQLPGSEVVVRTSRNDTVEVFIYED